LGFRGRILGISVEERREKLLPAMSSLATATALVVGQALPFDEADMLVNDAYLGAGYGTVDDATRDALRLLAGTEGVLLDPVYTGRAFAGLVDLIRRGFFNSDSTVVFWHTGGMPAVFAYSDEV
jgi:D-cysteine desulfhydrase